MFHTRDEAAGILRVHVRTVDRLIADGLLKASKGPGKNGAVRIADEALADYVERSTLVPTESEAAAS